MISRDDLKQMVMLSYLTDEMLARLVPITEMLQFEEKDYIFREGDKGNRLYFLVRGKVLLEQRISPTISVTIGSLKPGFSLGWSAMLDEDLYTSDAVCAEPTQMLSFRAEKLKALLENDYEMGYILSQRLLRVIKNRYDLRTEQFLKAIRHHPDIGNLL